jgi:hypothetical protein
MTSGIKPTPYQVQVKIFEAAGCTYVRTQGDHLVYHYLGAKRPVVIPKYKEVPVFTLTLQRKGRWACFQSFTIADRFYVLWETFDVT